MVRSTAPSAPAAPSSWRSATARWASMPTTSTRNRCCGAAGAGRSGAGWRPASSLSCGRSRAPQTGTEGARVAAACRSSRAPAANLPADCEISLRAITLWPQWEACRGAQRRPADTRESDSIHSTNAGGIPMKRLTTLFGTMALAGSLAMVATPASAWWGDGWGGPWGGGPWHGYPGYGYPYGGYGYPYGGYGYPHGGYGGYGYPGWGSPAAGAWGHPYGYAPAVVQPRRQQQSQQSQQSQQTNK